MRFWGLAATDADEVIVGRLGKIVTSELPQAHVFIPNSDESAEPKVDGRDQDWSDEASGDDDDEDTVGVGVGVGVGIEIEAEVETIRIMVLVSVNTGS